jgi:hypothetical protein
VVTDRAGARPRDPRCTGRPMKSFSFLLSMLSESKGVAVGVSPGQGGGGDDGGGAGTVRAVVRSGGGATAMPGGGLASATPMVDVRVRGFGWEIHRRRFRGWVGQWRTSGGAVVPPQPWAAGGVRGAMMDCSSVEEDDDTGRSVGHTFALSRDGSRDRAVRNLINPTCCVPEA